MRHQPQEPTLICGAFRAPAWVDDAEKGDGGHMKRSRKTQDGGKGKQREKINQEKYKEQGEGKKGQEEAESRQDETRHARQADLTRRESRVKMQYQPDEVREAIQASRTKRAKVVKLSQTSARAIRALPRG